MLKKLSTKAWMLVLLIFFGFQVAFAQTGSVTGTVTDAGDGTTLPGASVVVKGTTNGTVTDIDGNFTLSISANSVLEISFVGYIPQDIPANPGEKLSVALQPGAMMLEGAVVIGYGTVKKKDATGAVTAISANDFNKGAITSPASLIAGKVAGVQITSNGGAPGGSSTIRIRGGSSLNASNDPLFVIDGVPLSNAGGSGSRNPLNSINPNDIETFTVLKDASATAIYGSRASNGVIIITTKKGKDGAPLRLDYQAKFSLYEVPNTLGVLSSSEYQAAFNEKFPQHSHFLGVWYDADGNEIPAALLPADRTGLTQKMYDTDWQDEIFRNSFGMDHALSATGSWKMIPYRLSLGYTDQNGVVETSNFKRTTLSASLNPTFFDDHLKLNVNATGSFIKNEFANGGAIGSAIQMDPTKPINNNDGRYGGYWAWQIAGDNNTVVPTPLATKNPLALLNQNDDKSNVNRFYGNFQADYKLHFFPDLKANLNLGIDHSKNDGTVIRPNYASWAYNAVQGGGADNKYDSKNENELVDFYLNYNKEVKSIESNFDVMGGYSWQHFYNENTWNNNNIPVFIDPSTGDSTGQELINNSGINKGELYLVSFFGRLNYQFKNRYLLTATVRQDGTSRFSPDNRWGVFPSVSFGWKINEEAFLKDVDVISELKLRLSWGETGQQDIGGYYDYMGRYVYGNQFAMYPFGNTYYRTLRPQGYNPNLVWETTTTYNFGIDYSLFDGRLYGSLDIYNRETRDLLSWVPETAGANLTNYINKNIGTLQNNGVEFAVNGIIISKEDMFWELGTNVSYNKNEITKLYDGVSIATGGISGGVGNTIQEHAVGYSASTFYVYEQVYDESGNPIEGLYVDRNGDGDITPEDKYYYKDPTADLFFGISSTFNYQNWTLFLSGRANFGNYVYNNVESSNAWYDQMYRSEGPYASNIVSSISNTNFDNTQYFSDYYVQEASFFRMDDISVSYDFNGLLNDKLDITLSATCNNAFVITNYEGLDPEAPGGIDNNFYPRSRIWVFGLNLKF